MKTLLVPFAATLLFACQKEEEAPIPESTCMAYDTGASDTGSPESGEDSGDDGENDDNDTGNEDADDEAPTDTAEGESEVTGGDSVDSSKSITPPTTIPTPEKNQKRVP